MKPSKKLALGLESLRALNPQDSQDVVGGVRYTWYCNTDYTCYTDCGGSVCASACNTHPCP